MGVILNREIFQETGTSVQNNTSSVRLRITATTTGSSHNGYTQTATINFNGNVYYRDYTLPYTTTTLIFDETINIGHNTDGTGSAWFNASIPTGISAGTLYDSASITLSTIPRASALDSFTPGSDLTKQMTFKYTPKSNGFYYRLRLAIPNTTEIKIINLGQGGTTSQKTYNYTFTSSELSTIYNNASPSSASVSIKASLSTYTDSNYSNQIGSLSEITKSIELPATIIPVINSFTIQEAVSEIATKFNAYVQSKSRLNIASSSSGIYGSTITSNKIEVNGATYTSSSALTGVLTKSGSQTCKLTITDSRGRTATQTITFNVLAYTTPTISSFTANRNDTTKTTIDTKFTCNITSLNNLNDHNIKIQLDTTDKYTNTTDYSLTNETYAITNCSENSSFVVKLILTDFFGSTTKEIKIGTGFAMMNWSGATNGMAIGKIYDENQGGVLQVSGTAKFDDVIEGATSLANITETNPTSGTWYRIPFVWDGNSTPNNKVLRDSDGIKGIIQNGTTSAVGSGTLAVGNNKRQGTANNKRGRLRVYGVEDACSDLYSRAQRTVRNLYLPDKDGNIAIEGEILFTSGSTNPTTITLSADSTNYPMVEILFEDTKDYAHYNKGSVKVYEPNGKFVNMTLWSTPTSEPTKLRYATETAEISGNKIITRNISCGFLSASGLDTYPTKEIKIYKVIGYR